MRLQLFSHLTYAESNARLDAMRKVLACPDATCGEQAPWTNAADAVVRGWAFEDRPVDGTVVRFWYCPRHKPASIVEPLGSADGAQLRFESQPEQPREKRRAGCVGKVQRVLDARPWLTCGEIAAIVGEPSFRVSGCLNKLKHEGHAQYHEGLGIHGRCVWAGTSTAGQQMRDELLQTLFPHPNLERTDDDDDRIAIHAQAS